MGGQFFTDTEITKLAVNLLDFDPRKGDDLVDICAGTGGFLLAGLNSIQLLLNSESGTRFDEKKIVEIINGSLKGIEIDEEICKVANSTLQVRLGAKEYEIVSLGDSLNPLQFRANESKIKYDSHLCLATNPPFGTKITVKDPTILKNFELASTSNNSMTSLRPTPPDILLLEQNLKLLKKGEGRLAIVLPYQILSGPKTRYIRNWLLRNSDLIAVIDLPSETFQPYTGTKTSLVVVKRKSNQSADLHSTPDYNVFMATPRFIGHDRRGLPIFRREDGEIMSDIQDVIDCFIRFRANYELKFTSSNCFVTKFSDIVKDPLLRINARFWKPSAYSEIEGINRFQTNEWEVKKIKDLAKRIFYPGRFKRNYIEYDPTAIPFLGGADLNEFYFRPRKWLSPFDPKISELKVKKGWVLITRSGTTGLVSMVPSTWDGFAVSEHVIRIVPDETKIIPEYLLAVLQSKYIQNKLAKGVYGSVIDEIDPEYVGEIEIPVPKSKEEVKKIVNSIKEANKHRELGMIKSMDAIEKIDGLIGSN